MFHNYYLMSALHLVKSLLPFWDGHRLEKTFEVVAYIKRLQNLNLTVNGGTISSPDPLSTTEVSDISSSRSSTSHTCCNQ